MKFHPFLSTPALMAASFFLPSHSGTTEAAPLKKEKLQIVFCLGQSNMFGLAGLMAK